MLLKIVKTNKRFAKFIFCNDRIFIEAQDNTRKTDQIDQLNDHFINKRCDFVNEQYLKIQVIFTFQDSGDYVYNDCIKAICIQNIDNSELNKTYMVHSDNDTVFCKEDGNITMNHIFVYLVIG